MKKLAPIVLFVYNRPEHTERTLDALRQNELASESELFIFSDAAKNEENKAKVDEVRKIISCVSGFRQLHIEFGEKNRGLANSIISGVTRVINQYDRVIVLEDDLLTSPKFLKFMNDCLSFYESDGQIWSISGYHPPIGIPKKYTQSIYLSYRGSSWGWATWKDRWETVEWNITDYADFKRSFVRKVQFGRGGNNLIKMLDDCMAGKNHSWAVRWCYAESKQNKWTIYPVHSLIQNGGTDGSGTNYTSSEDRYGCLLDKDFEYSLSNEVKGNALLLSRFKRFYDRSAVRYIKRIFGLNRR